MSPRQYRGSNFLRYVSAVGWSVRWNDLTLQSPLHNFHDLELCGGDYSPGRKDGVDSFLVRRGVVETEQGVGFDILGTWMVRESKIEFGHVQIFQVPVVGPNKKRNRRTFEEVTALFEGHLKCQ